MPWVNRWGAESVDRLALRFDPHVGMVGVFDDDQDELVPDFTAQNMGRQREAVCSGICQVCARFVPWSRRFLVIAAMSTQSIVVAGRRMTVVTEPWLCERCALFALDRCPALIRRRRADDLALVKVERRDARLVVSSGVIDGPLAAESQVVRPAMLVKIALSHVTIVRVESVPTKAHA